MVATSDPRTQTDPDGLYWDAHVAKGVELRQQSEHAAWYLGTLALEVATAYGDKDLQRFAEAIAVEYNTLRAYRTVAAAFPEFDPRGSNVGFTILRTLAGREDRTKWLERAIAGNWSTRTLMQELDMADGSQQSPTPRAAQPTPEPPRRFRHVEGFTGWLSNQRATRSWIEQAFEESPDAMDVTPNAMLEELVRERDENIAMWQRIGDSAERALIARSAPPDASDEDGIERVVDDESA